MSPFAVGCLIKNHPAEVMGLVQGVGGPAPIASELRSRPPRRKK